MRLILAGVVLALMLTGCDAEKPSETKKPSETENPSGAEKLFEQGSAAYERGDYATALRLWRPLAEQGDATAQFAIGSRYEDGQGVPQSYAEAMKWYRLAAEQGHAWAQFRLGMMYREGRGAPHDFVQAYMWLNLAASRFTASETDNRNSVIRNRDRAASKLTPEQLAEAQSLAREWKPK